MCDDGAGIADDLPLFRPHVNAMGENATKVEQPVAAIDIGVTRRLGIKFLLDQPFFGGLLVQMRLSSQAEFSGPLAAGAAQRSADRDGEPVGDDEPASKPLDQPRNIFFEIC